MTRAVDREVPIRLIGVPIDTVRFAQRHHDALVRELELIILGPDQEPSAGVDRAALRADEARLRVLFAVFRPMVEAELAAAANPEAPAEVGPGPAGAGRCGGSGGRGQ